MEHCLIYVTASSRTEAESLARRLVEERLAACANVIERITSYYWWEGEVQSGEEAVVIAKTRRDMVEDVVAAVKRMHSYSCPCVVALPIVAGNPDFLNWIAAETTGKL
ncbi:MAG: divalent-cation tolerance protein CutA [Rhodospirillales bacterium]|nr:divalent-cation tolerance protein CutA [Rhodospirillales bacterium]